jgi:hypothetical protein
VQLLLLLLLQQEKRGMHAVDTLAQGSAFVFAVPHDRGLAILADCEAGWTERDGVI